MKKNDKIYIFGNSLLDFDNLPLKLKPELEKLFPQINFQITDPNENIKPINKELVIIDTVINTKKVVVINNIEKLETNSIYTAHDFDLAFNLKLLHKIGKLKKVTIFGVPPNITKKEALKQLKLLIG